MLQYNLNVFPSITATIVIHGVAQWDFITPRRNEAEGVKSQVKSIFNFDLKSQMAYFARFSFKCNLLTTSD